jgi:hypothetical protein
MRRPCAHWILLAGFLSSVLLVVLLGKRTAKPTTPTLLPLNDWHVPELADHLNRAGLRLHMVPTAKDGGVENAAFLSTTQKDWHEFNRLIKDGKQLAAWRGILYCERVESDLLRRRLMDQWGDFAWSAGPFLFCGDPELLMQVRAVLLDAPLGTVPPLHLAIVDRSVPSSFSHGPLPCTPAIFLG